MSTKEFINEFIIGLGGVGGRSIAAFRKTRLMRPEDDTRILNEGARFEYLYIDSNTDILKDGNWSLFGKDLMLNEQDIVLLKNNGKVPSLNEIAANPNIREWLGGLSSQLEKRQGSNADSQLQTMDGASQLRRFGRALFALHVDRIRNVLQSKINSLVSNSDRSINFRIFCTLGGGTGSGSVVDMVTLIRKICNDQNTQCKIIVYPFIAGKAIEGTNAGFFFENQYATLRDLNALAVRKYKPFVVGYRLNGTEENEFDLEASITSVVISSNEAPGSPDLKQQIDYITKACYDSIVVGYGCDPDFRRSLTGEDLTQGNPGDVLVENEQGLFIPETPDPDHGLTETHSYRFMAFAARRWCVPTMQIKELLRYDTETQILECWLNGSPMAKGTTKRASDQLPSLNDKQKLKLSSCETGQFLNKKLEELKRPLDNEYDLIEKNSRRDSTLLEELREMSEAAAKAAEAMLTEPRIKGELERCYEIDAETIFNQLKTDADNKLTWKILSGTTLGLKDIALAVEDIRTKGLTDWASEYINETFKDYANTLTAEAIKKQMVDREAEWQKLGFLTIHLTSKARRIIKLHMDDCRSLIMNAFKPFVQNIVRENLCDHIAKKLKMLGDKTEIAIKGIVSRIETIRKDHIGKIETDLEKHASATGVRDLFEYDKENLKKIREKIKTNTQLLYKKMESYSEEWDSTIGSLAEFSGNKFDKLCKEIDAKLYDTSKEFHDAVCDGDEIKQVLISSIYDRLLQLAGEEGDTELWNSRLSGRIQDFLGKLGLSTDIGSGAGGLTSPQVSPASAIAIGFPKDSPVKPEFKTWLEEKMESALPTEFSALDNKRCTFTHSCSNEIRVLYVKYWFPARMVPVVNTVYQMFKNAYNDKSGSLVRYFCNLDDNDNGLASKNRPALSSEGGASTKNAVDIDLATILYVSWGDQGEQIPIIKVDEKEIRILTHVDSFGEGEYSAYPVSMREFPTAKFKKELAGAYKLALESMTHEAKFAIVQELSNQLKELKNQGVTDKTPEYIELNRKRKLAMEKFDIK